MAQYRITYSDDRAAEVVEADRLSLQSANRQVLLHRMVTVAGQPREVVVRRLAGAEISGVDPC